MISKTNVVLLIVMFLAVTCFAAEGDSSDPNLPEKDTSAAESSDPNSAEKDTSAETELSDEETLKDDSTETELAEKETAEDESSDTELVAKDTSEGGGSERELPGKDTSEYWEIRSQALSELTPFLSRTRREAKGHYDALTHYIKYIGKGQDFLDSDIKVSFNPAEYAKAIGKSEKFVEENVELPQQPMAWEELVEFAMDFVLEEGYVPTGVKNDEEIEMVKKICGQKEVYIKKIRDELHKVAQDCMTMKAYLESIDEFEACVKYTRYQKSEEEQAEKERIREGKDELAANERARREAQKNNEWLDKQKRINNRYYDRGRAGGAYRRRRYHYNHW